MLPKICCSTSYICCYWTNWNVNLCKFQFKLTSKIQNSVCCHHLGEWGNFTPHILSLSMDKRLFVDIKDSPKMSSNLWSCLVYQSWICLYSFSDLKVGHLQLDSILTLSQEEIILWLVLVLVFFSQIQGLSWGKIRFLYQGIHANGLLVMLTALLNLTSLSEIKARVCALLIWRILLSFCVAVYYLYSMVRVMILHHAIYHRLAPTIDRRIYMLVLYLISSKVLAIWLR